MCKDTSINSSDLNKDYKHSRTCTLQITEFLMGSTLYPFCFLGSFSNCSGSIVESITSVFNFEYGQSYLVTSVQNKYSVKLKEEMVNSIVVQKTFN